ncbi:VOC family protein [Fodinicola acaciae]|uniref:VOC family protein n=1 Tax=Fodinicola acaciae TaxID=2681555 RepID=UPI0013CF7FBF|nr:VOC family protein [Fodinicola acaciae]
MTTEGIEGVFLETHNWGKSAKFFQKLGYEVRFSSDDGSGVLQNGTAPYLVLVEVPESQQPQMQLVLKVTDPGSFQPDVDVVTPFEDTHYGAKRMTVRDPDGRLWSIEAK